ncbi:MAG: nucleoid occlusion factor SlmA [Gammaproteobacteria bacterium]|nr:nucleoid occlusion factor SlmA [Gammaproteobacteria bacterium]
MSSLSPKALAVDDASDLDVGKPDAAKAAAPASTRSVNRKEEILQALAAMLEQSPGQRITTAAIANKVGVSEAALYRHFPSKARMFEGLIEFIETTLLGKIEQIIKQHKSAETRLKLIVQLLLVFAEKNPGMCRILTGDALHGEQERLRERVLQLFEKLEQQLKWCLRERKLREGKGVNDEAALANWLLASCEGKIHQFVRSSFTRLPTHHFDAQWLLIKNALS